MLYLISFALHLLIVFVFFTLIPLPVLVRSMKLESIRTFSRLLKFYKVVMIVAHGALVVGLMTGLFMYHDFTSAWLWFVLILWAAIGAFLGLSAKYTRITLEQIEAGKSYEESSAKLQVHSIYLMAAIVLMFLIKYIPN